MSRDTQHISSKPPAQAQRAIAYDSTPAPSSAASPASASVLPLVLRRNTIFDLTSLRLHPDGTRVHQNFQDNLRLGKPKNTVYAVQRRGWIAKDAAGDLFSDKGKRKNEAGGSRGRGRFEFSDRKAELEEGEIVDDAEREEEPVRGRTMKRRPREEVKSGRAKKRLRFQQDDSFIRAAGQQMYLDRTSTKNVDERLKRVEVEPPSSDLLKAIHHHSSEFCQSRGVLCAPRKHQVEIGKRLIKTEQNAWTHMEKEEATGGTLDLYTQDEQASESDFQTPHIPELVPKSTRKNYLPLSPETLAPSSSTSVRNMYRVFEGGSLLGLGILIQEKLTQLLEGKTPREVPDSERENDGQVVQYPTPYLDQVKMPMFGARNAKKKWRVESAQSEKKGAGVEKSSGISRFDYDGDYSSNDGGREHKDVAPMVPYFSKFKLIHSEETNEISAFTSNEEIDELDVEQW